MCVFYIIRISPFIWPPDDWYQQKDDKNNMSLWVVNNANLENYENETYRKVLLMLFFMTNFYANKRSWIKKRGENRVSRDMKLSNL